MEQEPAHMVYTEEQYLEAIRSNAPATTKEVADDVGVTRQGADYRLRTLEEDGVVSSEMLGNTLIWTVENAPDRRETPPEPPADVSPTEPAPVDEASEGDLEALVDDVVDDVLPGSGAKLEARREALHAVVDYLREHGEATPADFRRDVYPDHRARYTEGDDPARSWWKNAMYKGLAELAERTDAIERADTTGAWSFVGDDVQGDSGPDDAPTDNGIYDPTEEF